MKFENLTDKLLLETAKNSKRTRLYDSVLLGILVGVSIYSVIKNGLGLLSFLPLLYLPVARKNNVKRKAIEHELKDRGLK